MPVNAILIVEDHTMIAEYLASVLAGAGYEPIQAGDLASARRRLAERRYALWLCDRQLPDGDGATLLEERHGAHAGTPAIVISAELEAGIRTRLLQHGFDEALAKPCTPERLLAAVTRLVDATSRPGVAEVIIPPSTSAAILDDEAALRVCGSPATMQAMRRLLAGELTRTTPALHASWQNGDRDDLHQQLHKLSASAAWCGAVATEQACATLSAALAEACETSKHAAWTGLLDALDRLGNALAVAEVGD